MRKEIVLMIKVSLETDLVNNDDLLDELERFGHYEARGTKKVKINSSKAFAVAEGLVKKNDELLN